MTAPADKCVALADGARRTFIATFRRSPIEVATAPGRVNLIGEHTDYNDGFVLPMAIDRGVAVACAPRNDLIVRVHSAMKAETREFSIAASIPRSADWAAYVAGVVWALEAAGHSPRGVDLAILSDLPAGAGLSSSAALELAIARAVCAASGIDWQPRQMAMLARKAENEFVGVSCGIMDQFASAMATSGCALLLDCRSLETAHIPIPADAAIVVMDTGVRRSLTGSQYNERRAACERAVLSLQRLDRAVKALRDVDEALLARGRDQMDEEAYRRARHVVAEITRPQAMTACLAAGDLKGAGILMNASHESLRDLYEVSCDELDRMVASARSLESCYGARLTGAGFGGCAIALVAASEVASFVPAVSAAYTARTGIAASLFVTRAAEGGRLMPPPLLS